jgi:hypothetical protein
MVPGRLGKAIATKISETIITFRAIPKRSQPNLKALSLFRVTTKPKSYCEISNDKLQLNDTLKFSEGKGDIILNTFSTMQYFPKAFYGRLNTLYNMRGVELRGS